MRDQKITLPRIQLLHPKVREETIYLVEKAEAQLSDTTAIRIVQGLRTKEDQDALYAIGRTKPGKIVTNAKFGQSYHCYGLAIDFCLLYDTDNNGTFDELSWDIRRDNDQDKVADWLEVVKIFETAGWFWGGKWASLKDYPHLEKPFGFKWQELLRKYNDKEFIAGTNYVQIP